MKKTLLSLSIILFSTAAMASGICEKKAVQVAKDNSDGGNTIYAIQSLPVEKNYLESYRVEVRNSDLSESSQEIFDIVLLTSKCSVASVIRRF